MKMRGISWEKHIGMCNDGDKGMIRIVAGAVLKCSTELK
jgi:hypothetical protein